LSDVNFLSGSSSKILLLALYIFSHKLGFQYSFFAIEERVSQPCIVYIFLLGASGVAPPASASL